MPLPGESPTKWQAQAYRFGVRRLESAVASGDPLLRGDPVRRRLNLSLIVSIVLAALILGGFAVYGFIRPAPTIGDASVVIDSDTGGVFVSRDGRLYPAMNLASALLAAGRGRSGQKAPSVTTVNSDAVGEHPRGPLLGIPGAPNVLPARSALVDSRWTVCDSTRLDPALPPGSRPTLSTTAILGENAPRSDAPSGSAMLVSADAGTTTFLVWDGRRSRVDATSDTIRLALDLETDAVPRPMSAALLDAIPQGQDIVPPEIRDAGSRPRYADELGVRVGEVFGLEHADRSRAIYVALSDGVEKITPFVGDLIRDEFDENAAVPLIAPSLLRQAPQTSQPIDLGSYPEVRPTLVGYDRDPVACVRRTGNDAGNTEVVALPRVPVPRGAQAVAVTRPGPLTVDAVYVRPGHGAVLGAATSTQPSGARALYVVTDDGVAYPVVDATALGSLGFSAKDVRPTAPELINLLPKGPALDPDQAVHFYPQTGASAGSLPSASAAASGPRG